MAATNKCLAQSHKSATRAGRLKTRMGIDRQPRAALEEWRQSLRPDSCTDGAMGKRRKSQHKG